MLVRHWSRSNFIIFCLLSVKPVTSFSQKPFSKHSIRMVNESPQSEWIIGTKQKSPHEGQPFTAIDPNEVGSVYSLMIRYAVSSRVSLMCFSSRAKISFTSIHCSAVTPRPVAFVSTCSAAGINNLSPFSYFSVVSHDPPIVSIGICANRDGSKKDTLVNIEVNSSNSTQYCC